MSIPTNGKSKEYETLVKNKIKQSIPNLKEDEFALFMHIARSRELDPLLNQIYCVKMGGKITAQTSIDGLRLVAERTGKYAPGKAPEYVYDDNGNLLYAIAFVKKQTNDGSWHETASQAFYKEYKGNGGIWGKLPHVMLAKCAESQALRKAFPAELSGLYSEEEMEQSSESVEKEPEKITEEHIKELNVLFEAFPKNWKVKALKSSGKEKVEELTEEDFERISEALNATLVKELKQEK